MALVTRSAAHTLAIVLSLTVHTAAAAALLLPRRTPTREEHPAHDETSALAGESFELPAPEATSEIVEPELPASPSVAPAQAPASAYPAAPIAAPMDEGTKPRAPASPAGKPSHNTSPAHTNEPPGSVEPGGAATSLYGAAGDRTAVDLATAITRGFPQAASADPAWASAPLGPAGDATVVLTLDESGKLVGSELVGAASPALAAGIRRTLALVGGRAFTSRGKVTRLHLVATVSTDTVHDGLHGDVFAIGGSYTGNEGLAFFALAIGRRVDLRVRPR